VGVIFLFFSRRAEHGVEGEGIRVVAFGGVVAWVCGGVGVWWCVGVGFFVSMEEEQLALLHLKV
jgi:hypothetical protein